MIFPTNQIIIFMLITIRTKLTVSQNNTEEETKESTLKQSLTNLLVNSDFEDATISPWEISEDDTDAIIEKSEEYAYSGNFGGIVVGRTEKGEGICQDITSAVEWGVNYEASLWAKLIDVPEGYSESVRITVHNRMKQVINGFDTYHDSYYHMTDCGTRLTNEWTKIVGSYLNDNDEVIEILSLKLCFQGPSSTAFAIDDVMFRVAKTRSDDGCGQNTEAVALRRRL